MLVRVSLLVSDGLSLVKAPHSLFLLALVDSPLVECETLDYSCDLHLFHLTKTSPICYFRSHFELQEERKSLWVVDIR